MPKGVYPRPEPRRVIRHNIRLTPDEYLRLKKKAYRAGVSETQFIVDCCGIADEARPPKQPFKWPIRKASS